MRLDAFGICLLKQTASSAQSVASPSKIEEFREFKADLSALFLYLVIYKQGRKLYNKKIYRQNASSAVLHETICGYRKS